MFDHAQSLAHDLVCELSDIATRVQSEKQLDKTLEVIEDMCDVVRDLFRAAQEED